MSTTTHSWRFFVAGGVNQVRLETADDLRFLPTLDPKLWTALSCPVAGHAMDARTMALVDADSDGRVRVPEILGAVAHVVATIRDPAAILTNPKTLSLAALRDDTPQGRVVRSAAETLLRARGATEPLALRLEDVADLAEAFAQMPLNGDGVVHAGATDDPGLKCVIGEIIAAVGGVPDRSGAPGVSATEVDAFFEVCAGHSAWLATGSADPATLFPLGDRTDAALAAYQAVAPKVEDFFARCRLASFDVRLLEGLEAGGVPSDPALIGADCAPFAGLPLATVAPGAALALGAGLNPAWRDRMAAFVGAAVVPLQGSVPELTGEAWGRIVGKFAAPLAWRSTQGGAAVASLGGARVAELLASDLRSRLLALIAADEARRPEAEAVVEVERTVRYFLQLGRLLRNFVNFSDFYGRREPAIFQAGTAFFDQRSCELTVRVADEGRHGAMATAAGAFLAYLDCVRPVDGARMTVCVAVTDGDSANLIVGMNGLFYDRAGRDYDARITRIVDHPISLRQAFWAPYTRFVRTVEDLVARRAAAAEAGSSSMVAGAAEATANADHAPAPASKPMDIGTVAAIGVAVGGISAAIGALLQAFFGLGVWMPVGVLALMLLISGPSVLIAALKLRRRSVGPLLDADGWAVNAHARINLPFGRSLTSLAALPPGSSRDLHDPFAPRPPRWPYVVAAVVIVIAAVLTLLIVSGHAGFLVR